MNYENEFGVCLRSYTIKLEKEEYSLYCLQCLTIKHGCKTLPRKSVVLRNTSEMYRIPVPYSSTAFPYTVSLAMIYFVLTSSIECEINPWWKHVKQVTQGHYVHICLIITFMFYVLYGSVLINYYRSRSHLCVCSKWGVSDLC